ncbi:hypothetical protein SCHPADRAFT_125402 [Schizopora paradoxa]|uniref:F-box domain-containing protein n=1 Tax=Schizopora paradoxa TaxID=27342 RepID=A0A0H2S2G2_9AGAM|nr:hypothetical protein SCHPADRAFT_125402 [Schizopora paradoxa]
MKLAAAALERSEHACCLCATILPFPFFHILSRRHENYDSNNPSNSRYTMASSKTDAIACQQGPLHTSRELETLDDRGTLTSTPRSNQSRSSFAQDPPAELLSEILLHNLPTHYMTSMKADTAAEWQALFSAMFPNNVACVSQTWRHVALSTHALWSTWFVELENPSPEGLAILHRFLERFIDRSGSRMPRPHIRFIGTSTCMTSQICWAFSPLLQCQERWENAEICHGWVEEEVLGFPLDFSRLSSLQALTAHGSMWNCIDEEFKYIFNQDLALPPLMDFRKLSSLRSAELIEIPLRAYFPFLYATPNLTELVIYIDDEIDRLKNTFPRRVCLPCLRKLELQRLHPWREYSDLAQDPNRMQISLLYFLEFGALEELTINGAALPALLLLDFTIRFSKINITLRTLRFSKGVVPVCYGNDIVYVSALLGSLQNLRHLEFYGESSVAMLPLFILLEDGTERFILCPLLETFVLSGVTSIGGDDRDFLSQIVSKRWNAPERSIRAISFINCKYFDMLDLDEQRPKDLLDIPGSDSYIKEGLQLRFSKTEVFQ